MERGGDFSGTAYRLPQIHNLPSHSSKTVLSIVKIGPPSGDGGRYRAVDLRGERRVNETHESRTDPGARLARKGVGKEARLCYEGHVLMDNLQGLVVDVKITEATGTSERDTALDMLQMAPGGGRITVGADRGGTTPGTSYGTVGTCTSRRTWPETTLGDRRTDHTA